MGRNYRWLAAGLIVIGALFYYVGSKNMPVVLTDTGRFDEHTDQYDIIADYATSTPMRTSIGAEADTRAIGAMKDFVDATIDQFKEDVAAVPLERKASLTVVYLIALGGPTLSYIYTISADTGGAHGNMYFKTFAFNSNTGQHLALQDLFEPDMQYLERLSSLSRSVLAENMAPYADSEQIARGTEPDAENFRNFFIAGDRLALLFPPYQVGPYAAGPQTLYIPLSELAHILKSEYRP